MEKIEIIKERLKEAIIKSKLSQTEIAKLLSVSQSCIAHYIKGDIVPAIDTFSTLCEILDEDANYLLGINKK